MKGMLQNYSKIAVRHLLRHRGYTAINLFGLSVGIAVCLIIFLFVQEERRYDRFHTDGDRIFRLNRVYPNSLDPRWPARLYKPLVDQYPEIEAVTRVFHVDKKVLTLSDRRFISGHLLFTDPSFLEVFDFPLLETASQQPLLEPMTALVTRSAAMKYFGRPDPIGEVFRLEQAHTFTVTGILEDVNEPSHLRFEMLLSVESMSVFNAQAMELWSFSWPHYYLLLQPQVDTQRLEERFAAFWGQLRGESTERAAYLQPLFEIHIRSTLLPHDNDVEKVDLMLLRGFSIIGALVLLLACFNYANLATAQALRRVREVGIRKALGARRQDLIIQFVGETWIITFLAVVLAVMLTDASIPLVRSLFGSLHSLDVLDAPVLLLGLPLIVLFVGLIAGSYPALVLSHLPGAQVLKGQTPGGSGRGHRAPVRRILVFAQFTVSAALVAATLIIYRQIFFIRTFDLGINTDHLVVVYNNYPGSADERFPEFMDRVRGHPGVREISAANQLPPLGVPNWNDVYVEGKKQEHIAMGWIAVNAGLLRVIGAQLVEGRLFDPERQEDGLVVLNESAVASLSLSNPIGTELRRFWDDEPATVVGVVKDIYHKSLHERVDATLYHVASWGANEIVVRLDPIQAQETLAFMEGQWGRVAPEWPFQYDYLDERIDLAYRKEHQTEHLFMSVTVLALLISCLGLLGLAAFSMQLRTKEVGIRKVLGSSVVEIIRLFIRESVILALSGCFLAAPIAVWIAERWLSSFAYRADIGFIPLAATVILMIGLALATVGLQAFRAATANPVDALRDE